MSLKFLLFFILLIAFSFKIEASLYTASAAVGESFNFDFGKDLTSLRITRNGVEEILNVGKESTHSNVKLSNDGILTISPVTENDFADYVAINNKETKVDSEIITVAPPTLQLIKKE